MAAFWKKKTGKAQTLSSLIRGLQFSVNSAMDMLESRNQELLGRYFNENGQPLIKRLNLNEKTAVDIPLISIVNPAALNIQEMEIDFSVQIDSTELHQKEPYSGLMVKDAKGELKLDWESSGFQVSFNGKPDQNTMHVKIKFCAVPIPEGLSRVIEEYDKTIMSFNI